MLKQPTPASGLDFNDAFEVITIGSEICVFQKNSKVTTYDFVNDEWSEKTCEATKDLELFSVFKYKSI